MVTRSAAPFFIQNLLNKKTSIVSLFLFAILAISIVINPIVLVKAQSINLISNPSVENGTTTLPTSWVTEKWGTNTSTFSYMNTGYDGTRSLYVKVTARTNGDAKWVFNPVTVSPNTTYYFSDYYKSTSKSAVVVRLLDSANNESYIDLGNQAISSNWKNINLSFKTASNTVKVTVLLLLRINGELWTDNFYLSNQPNVTTTPTPTITPTNTITPTIKPTQTVTPTLTPTNTPTVTPSFTPTVTPTLTPTNTTIPTTIPSPTLTPTNTTTPTVTPTNTQTPTITPTPIPTNTNVPNPSFEQVSNTDSQLPQSWNKGGWGTNTPVFSYLNTGHTGTRSGNVTISTYTDGDAKWYYDPQQVQGGTKYDFVDYYQSNVTTYITVEVTNSDNSLTYMDLGTVPASSTWARTAFEVTLPAAAVKATVFHHLDSVGSLTTDDFIFEPAATFTVVNGVPNNSVEKFSQLAPSKPLAWTQSSWGTNTPVFSYLNTGHTGNHSLKIDMNTYTDGDAKWAFDAQNVQGGKDYEFSDWYITDISSKIVVEVTHQDNSLNYLTLGTFSATPTWKQAVGTITMPADAVKATVYHLIDSKGTLTTDDFSFLQVTRVGLNRPIVSINFDDGWQSIYDNGLPLFNKYGLKTTQYLVSGFLNTPQYMTNAQAQAFITNGHQIGSHSVDHLDLTTLTAQQITDELQQSKASLESTFGIQVKDYAAPYGTYNDTVINIAKNYYRSYRTTDVGFVYKSDFDAYKIKTQNITNTTTLSEVQSWLNEAAANKTWLVLVYHEVNTAGREYSTTPTELDNELQAIKNSGITVETMDQAITEIMGQL